MSIPNVSARSDLRVPKNGETPRNRMQNVDLTFIKYVCVCKQ